MNGNEIVADTSLLINFFNGIELAKKTLKNHHIWTATSIYLDFPLITMDSDFNKINQLNALVLESE